MSNSKHYSVTDNQKEILTLLVKYRFLTTLQLHKKLNTKYSLLTTWRWLNKLRGLEMIKSFVCELHRGNNSEFGWLLTRTGAKQVEFMKYNSHYQRIPSQEQLFIKEIELILEEEVVYKLGWNLCYPSPNNPNISNPISSEQYRILSQAIKWKEYARERTSSDNYTDFQSLVVPLKANCHVAYLQNPDSELICRAIILIICPLHASPSFWNARIKQYELLAKKLPIFVIFADREKEQRLYHEQFLGKYNFRTVFVSQISQVLETA